MEAKVQKWGNSLAIRIPAVFGQECHLKNGAIVEMIAKDGRIIIKSKQPKLKLANILAKISANNLHTEVEVGKAVGREVLDD